jgi:hypothetical protein
MRVLINTGNTMYLEYLVEAAVQHNQCYVAELVKFRYLAAQVPCLRGPETCSVIKCVYGGL